MLVRLGGSRERRLAQRLVLDCWRARRPNSPIEGSAILTDEQINFLKTGLLYFKVHSDQFPDGEIRGQILIDPSSSGYDGIYPSMRHSTLLSCAMVNSSSALGV